MLQAQQYNLQTCYAIGTQCTSADLSDLHEMWPPSPRTDAN
jgi:hypothetical protein